MISEDDFFKQLEMKFLPKPSELFSKIKKISEEAYCEAMKNVLKQAYTRNIFNSLLEGDMKVFQGIKDSQLQMLLEESDRLSTKSPYWFITINPRPNVDLSTLQKVISKLITKKSIQSYSYVYEIRDFKDNKYTGLHCHILLEHNDKPYNFKRSVKSTVKNICDFNNPHILNFKNVPTLDSLKQKYQYILGNKKDSKKKGVAHTITYRVKNKLDSIYESNPPLPCRITEELDSLIIDPLIALAVKNEGTNERLTNTKRIVI